MASAINKDGVVVGRCSGKQTGWNGWYAVLWRVDAQGRVSITTLGPRGSAADGINTSQQVVGSNGESAFLWQNGFMSDLRILTGLASDYTMRASEINDSRMILHTASYLGRPNYPLCIAVPNSLLP